MGWWKHGEDLLGDGPADLFQEGMKAYGDDHGKPSWQDFLDALDAALESGRLNAAFDGGTTNLSSDPRRAKPVLRDAVASIIQDIRDEYQERRGRQPKLSEIIATAQFSVAGRPESFLSGGPMTLKQLILEEKK